MKRILFVDDEPNVLQGLKRMLRPMRNEWDMQFAEGGQQAIDIIGDCQFDVVVSDMRMPGIDGLQVLGFTRDHSPSSARVVLSGQTDKESILKSSGLVHQFISKPCDAENLKTTISKACSLRQDLSNEKMAAVIGGLKSLPSLPAVYHELTDAINDSDLDSSVDKIAAIVCLDIAMSAKVLQLANSAFFGLASKISTAQHATTILGGEVIRSLALTEAAFRAFTPCKNIVDIEALWLHCMKTSSVAIAIAKSSTTDKSVIDQSLQAGAFHDIGKLILANVLPEDNVGLYLQPVENLVQLEESIFGCNHGQAGGYLLGLWGLPDPIVTAVAYHNNPETIPHSNSSQMTPLIAVHVASAAVNFHDGDNNAFETQINYDWLRSMQLETSLQGWLEISAAVLKKEV